MSPFRQDMSYYITLPPIFKYKTENSFETHEIFMHLHSKICIKIRSVLRDEGITCIIVN